MATKNPFLLVPPAFCKCFSIKAAQNVSLLCIPRSLAKPLLRNSQVDGPFLPNQQQTIGRSRKIPSQYLLRQTAYIYDSSACEQTIDSKQLFHCNKLNIYWWGMFHAYLPKAFCSKNSDETLSSRLILSVRRGLFWVTVWLFLDGKVFEHSNWLYETKDYYNATF